MWVDAHIHAYHVPGAREEGKLLGIALLCTGEDAETSKKCMEYEYRAVGIHPANWRVAKVEEIVPLLEKAYAVGEIGMDPKYGPLEEQRKVYLEQVALAEEHNLPIVVHSRNAEKEILSTDYDRVYLHWYKGDPKEAVERGWYVGVGPWILYSKKIRKIVEAVPLDLVLTETDGPVRFSGVSARPSWIPRVAEEIARIKGVSVEEVKESVWENFQRFIRGP